METDPVTGKSLSLPLLVASLCMLAGLGWAIWDDAIGSRPWKSYQKQFAAAYSRYLLGLPRTPQVRNLLRKGASYPVAIRQIYVPEAQIVDRCESCHLGMAEPLELSAAGMGNRREFASHPRPDLLRLHPPERFGCTFCHGGNGAATSSVEKAHGLNRDWAWPLLSKQNVEAGCVACHASGRATEGAAVLNAGRDLYERKGCATCHRNEAFDRETIALEFTRAQLRGLDADQRRDSVAMAREVELGDAAGEADAARRHYAESERLRMAVSERAGRVAELNREAGEMEAARRDFGPNLKEARLKLRKEWIPVWLRDPRTFREGTHMPRFRLSETEARALAAFVWQSAENREPPEPQPAGNAARGKDLFEMRGCLGCHSIGEGARRQGGDFAANLSRLGEKTNYAYVVSWIRNPRARARTVMPSLRLSAEDARDIAACLMASKRDGVVYPSDVAFMDDPRIAAEGRKLAIRYGCSNCHEIRGLETPRVGAELTAEGSKGADQLDFGELEGAAKREGWYSAKDFFEHKLAQPALFDKGRERKPEERLKMPDIALSDAERTALTTLLLGSVDVPENAAFRTIPRSYRYNPAGAALDAQEGWWVIKKYNCAGCHEIEAGVKPVLSGTLRYADPEMLEQLPPALNEEGARVNPEWLSRFLANPALSDGDTARNGVRTYLAVRMPSFNLSPREIQALVRFFSARSGERLPWTRPPLESLTRSEKDSARMLFSSSTAPCLKCHLTGDATHDARATAPNFLSAAARLKPEWTARWMVDPQSISPGTAMPKGLFRNEGARWIFDGPAGESVRSYRGDQVDLLVRYIFQLDAEEQRRLMAMLPSKAR
jgi:mono/diheme cytochrome c family protein